MKQWILKARLIFWTKYSSHYMRKATDGIAKMTEVAKLLNKED